MFGRLSTFVCRLFGCREELITISGPVNGATVTSPLTVTGRGRAAQHNQLAVEVRDSSNVVVGSGPASISGPLGQAGPYSASITFTPGAAGTPAVIQVFDTSPATGSIIHLASVMVRF